MKKNIAQRVEEKIRPSVEGFGYELVDVEYVKEAGVYYLRVIIEIGRASCRERVFRAV